MRRFGVLAVIAAVLLLSGVGAAYAHNGPDECPYLGGAVVSGVCRITTAVIKSSTGGLSPHGGPFDIFESLVITNNVPEGTGSITVPAGGNPSTLVINITGSLTMEDAPLVAGVSKIVGDVVGAGAKGATITITASGDITLQGGSVDPDTPATGARITSNQSAGSCTAGNAGDITLTSTGGNISISDAAVVSSNGTPCPAGAIIISAPGSISISGKVLAESTLSGTGAKQRPGGGPITITAGCSLAVYGDTGVVQSKGSDPGADLVHLQAGPPSSLTCEGAPSLFLSGLVASTGPGHAVPNFPPNSCSDKVGLAGSPPRRNPATRPGKPQNSTACIEAWSTGTVTLVADVELNADTAQSGGHQIAWIDILGQGAIKIHEDQSPLPDPFFVHVNELGVNTATGGLITVQSCDTVSASGYALQADATLAGGTGGKITVEATNDVIFHLPDDESDEIGAWLFARGDFDPMGGLGKGGKIAVRAFNGKLEWTGVEGNGDVRPTVGPNPGTIDLKYCTSVDTFGTDFHGLTVVLTGSCGGVPVLAPYAVAVIGACPAP